MSVPPTGSIPRLDDPRADQLTYSSLYRIPPLLIASSAESEKSEQHSSWRECPVSQGTMRPDMLATKTNKNAAPKSLTVFLSEFIFFSFFCLEKL